MNGNNSTKASSLLPNMVVSLLAIGALHAPSSASSHEASGADSAGHGNADADATVSAVHEAHAQENLAARVKCPNYYNSGTGECRGEYSMFNIVTGTVTMGKFAV